MGDSYLRVLAHQGFLRESSAEKLCDDLRVHIDGRVLGHSLVETLDFFCRDLASIITSVDVCDRLDVHQFVSFLDLSLLASFVEYKANDLCVFGSHHRQFVLIDMIARRVREAKADEFISALIISAALSCRNKRSMGLGNETEKSSNLNISSTLDLNKRLFNLLTDDPNMLCICLLLNG